VSPRRRHPRPGVPAPGGLEGSTGEGARTVGTGKGPVGPSWLWRGWGQWGRAGRGRGAGCASPSGPPPEGP
jgi:hypothetical protein